MLRLPTGFSDYLSLGDELERENIFDPILDSDSHFFINLQRLKKASTPEFQESYQRINEYFRKIIKLLDRAKSKSEKPGKYKQEHFDNYQQWNRVVSDDEWLWNTYMVWRIIKCYSYTGALVHGTTKRLRVGGKARRAVPQNEQIIVEGVHPAIVTKDEWEAAQAAIRSISKRALPQKTNFPLTSKVRCGNCGCSMPYDDHGTPSLCCLHRQGVGKHSKCDSTVYEAKAIVGIVSHALRTKVALFRNFNAVLQEQKENESDPVQDRLRLIKEKIETLKARRIHLYEAYAEEIISKESYLSDKDELIGQIEQLEKEQKTLLRSAEEEDALLSGVKRIAEDYEQINEKRERNAL